ncbi:GNAT family N-acetyltransferase [Actinomadura oligospora]|uniref:GNAT family N-acetyltransferase n=1 Tax=Actinomadura oligospora TaxID=111804 RepID=UPI00047DC185|nr:GNAT family N-acetyltransferase [Actinomadura oligospora]
MLHSDRLVLRRWREDDRAPFAALNADPEVMKHFPAVMTRAESDAMIDSVDRAIEERGFGFWALEVAATGRFIGITGLSVPRFDAHFTPTVEVGWRLTRDSWGHGYATEAALRCLDFAFTELDLPEVVAFTTVDNARSRAVMRRIGMTRDPDDDFEHPNLPEGHPVRPHVLYRITPADHRPR